MHRNIRLLWIWPRWRTHAGGPANKVRTIYPNLSYPTIPYHAVTGPTRIVSKSPVDGCRTPRLSELHPCFSEPQCRQAFICRRIVNPRKFSTGTIPPITMFTSRRKYRNYKSALDTRVLLHHKSTGCNLLYAENHSITLWSKFCTVLLSSYFNCILQLPANIGNSQTSTILPI